MPANPKYLSNWGARMLKISAGIIGGYLLSGSMHLLLALIPGIGFNLLITGVISVFLFWAIFMILAFLSRNGWVMWAIYLGLSAIFIFIAYNVEVII